MQRDRCHLALAISRSKALLQAVGITWLAIEAGEYEVILQDRAQAQLHAIFELLPYSAPVTLRRSQPGA